MVVSTQEIREALDSATVRGFRIMQGAMTASIVGFAAIVFGKTLFLDAVAPSDDPGSVGLVHALSLANAAARPVYWLNLVPAAVVALASAATFPTRDRLAEMLASRGV